VNNLLANAVINIRNNKCFI